MLSPPLEWSVTRCRRAGFSLVELMIVVAILGVLAAIAIPAFMDMQLKAKRAELPTNVTGIKVAQLTFDATNDGYAYAQWEPRTLAGDETDKVAVAWPSPNEGGWSDLGWVPDGPVRGSYATCTFDDGVTQDVCVVANENVAGDGVIGTVWANSKVDATTDLTDACSCFSVS